MKQFKMEPGVDYVDNLKDNEPIADFVALSKKADDLIQGLLTGKVVAIGPVNDNSLQKWIGAVKILLNSHQPTGFSYIFPINRLDNNNKNRLEQLKQEFPKIDIQYYDCDSVDKLIMALEKVKTLRELVEYIKQARN